ncbi:MAG: hypothetical protein ACTSU2_01655 [Promethearchaeota archaeon]
MPTKSIGLEDIILLLDEESNKIYVWKGMFAPDLDEYSSGALYDLIINRFLNPNIYLIKEPYLEINENEEYSLKKVKNYLKVLLPDLKKAVIKEKLKNIFFLKKVRENIKKFSRYENSKSWRNRLSNLTELRKLSIFNVIAIIAVVIMLLLKIQLDLNSGDFIFFEQKGSDLVVNRTLWDLWLSTLSTFLLICILILGSIFIINLLFVVFPLRWPINPKAMDALKYGTFKELEEAGVIVKKEVELKEGAGIQLPPKLERRTSEAAVGGYSESALETSLETQKASTMEPPPKPKLPSISINLPTKPSKRGAKASSKKERKTQEEKVIDEYAELGKEFSSEKDLELNIPMVPLKKKETLKTQNIDDKLSLESADPNYKIILVECDICGKPIKMPVLKKLIEESKLPVTDVTYIHGDPPHAVTAQLDKNFDVRRRRSSPIVFEDKKIFK